MNVQQAQQLASQLVSGVDRSFVFQADRAFISTLTIGQVIKGKVLRHYDGGRYGVEFGSQERVVDSAIPLRIGDVIQGRVVGLGEKVVLERVVGTPPDEIMQAPEATRDPRANVGRDSIRQLFRDHRAKLEPSELALLQAMGRGDSARRAIASSALVLRKLGLNIDRTLVRAVSHALSDRGRVARNLIQNQATALTAHADEPTSDNSRAVAQLTQTLTRLAPPGAFDDPASGDRSESVGSRAEFLGSLQTVPAAAGNGQPHGEEGTTRDHREWLLGRWILNMQNESVLEHRLLSLPMWLGDRLVELNLAFFAQSSPEDLDDPSVPFRRIVFSLDLDVLGRVEVTVRIADRRLRIQVETESERATQTLAAYLGVLKRDLLANDWALDEVSYATLQRDEVDAPARAVVEHYIRQDSLSRLF